jgi:hypothetical protein
VSVELPIAEPITEEWLSSAGFRWHQLDRQPEKHWVLWLGDALEDRMTSFADLGIEVCAGGIDDTGFAGCAPTGSSFDRSSLCTVTQHRYSRILGTIRAAIDFAFVLGPMTNDPTPAMGACGRHRLDGTFEAVEG